MLVQYTDRHVTNGTRRRYFSQKILGAVLKNVKNLSKIICCICLCINNDDKIIVNISKPEVLNLPLCKCSMAIPEKTQSTEQAWLQEVEADLSTKEMEKRPTSLKKKNQKILPLSNRCKKEWIVSPISGTQWSKLLFTLCLHTIYIVIYYILHIYLLIFTK